MNRWENVMKSWFGSSLTIRLLSLLFCFVLCLGVGAPAFAEGTSKASGGESQKSSQVNGVTGIDSMPRLGVQGFALDTDAVLQAVADTRAGFVRVPLSWATMEPLNTGPSGYNWSG